MLLVFCLNSLSTLHTAPYPCPILEKEKSVKPPKPPPQKIFVFPKRSQSLYLTERNGFGEKDIDQVDSVEVINHMIVVFDEDFYAFM